MLEERLQEDLTITNKRLLAVTAQADPVLAKLWNNPKDAEYDRI